MRYSRSLVQRHSIAVKWYVRMKEHMWQSWRMLLTRQRSSWMDSMRNEQNKWWEQLTWVRTVNLKPARPKRFALAMQCMVFMLGLRQAKCILDAGKGPCHA